MRRRACSWWKVFLAYLIILSCVRVGEASNPGPSTFVVGAINPTGLLGKVEHIAALPPGVYGVSETHLSSLGVSQFRRELQSHRVPAKFLSSQPAPLIRSSMGVIGGKCTGVGFVSHHPGRNLPVNWPESLHQEARTHVASFCINGVWIKMGVVYGYAHRPTNVATQTKTDQLLSLAVDRVVHECSGPRIIMGDWNQPAGVLSQEKVLLAKGFVEIQVLAEQLLHRKPSPTCKGSTIKDFMWISPELIPMLLDVNVDQFAFPDHAVLSASFRSFAEKQPIQTWPKPAPIPWEEIESPLEDPPSVDIQPDCLQDALVQIMENLEDGAHRHLCQNRKQGLHPKHKGRCKTIAPVKCKHPIPSLPNGRKGDHQPGYFGENFQHYMWLKQLRRLQSLVKLLHSSSTPSHIEHGTKLWEVIRKAPGFPTDFAKYWLQRNVVLPNSPCVIPHALPSHEVAMCIHTTFEIEFRQLEQALWAKRGATARASRLLDTNKVFMDVAKPRAQPVQTLVKSVIADVTQVSEDGMSIFFESHQFEYGLPTFGPHGLLKVNNIEPGKLLLDQSASIEPGDVIRQQEPCGQTAEVTKEFEALWLRFWGNHQDATAEKWQPFVDMIRQEIPPPQTPMQLEPISLETWRKALRRKKGRSATGPDGVSRMDLLRMTDTATKDLLRVLQFIEQGSTWPKSMMVGLISMLEKKEHSEAVTDFRPICIFSMIYRTWASIRARQILRYLTKQAPEELVGNRPRKETADIWWTISLQIEASLHGNASMAGATADICKCFNALPRVPVSCLAEWLGIPAFFTNTWLRALHTMERRFVVHGGIGSCVKSTCGYPEGDPLSVCAMFMVNLALHRVLTSRQPAVTTWTFVDDWQFTGEDDDEIDIAFQEVSDFASLLDLDLDPKKCFVWGTTTAIRDGFRRRRKRVRLHERNLGGHISYCKIPTNYTLRDRIVSFEPTWTWLKRSHASIPQKLKVVTVVAWPRCLHGIANIPLGNEHFATLRSRVMQSLAWNKKGANPSIQLALVQGVRYDPGYYALVVTIKAFRFCNPYLAFPLLDALSQSGQHLRCPGPCGIFLTRLFDVGWSWEGDGFLSDHEGIKLHIFDTAIQTLEQHLKHAWICKVGSSVSVREGFAGVEFVSPSLTISQLEPVCNEADGLLRTVLNGTFFTRDKQLACGTVVSDRCPFCQQPDSIRHRHFECAQFQPLRDALPPSVFQFLEEAPQCTVQHGWFCEPAEVRLLRHALSQLPDLTGDFVGHYAIPSTTPIHLFCDGSCLQPTIPELRVATWGVCIANLEDDTFTPISQGPVWGTHQSSTRAEFTAVISSLKFAIHVNTACWIWTDNQTVYNFMQDTLDPTFFVTGMEKDHDLRSVALSLSRTAQSHKLLGCIIKVRSHMNRAAFTDVVEQWAIRGNDFADQCADRAKSGFNPMFWTLWEQAAQQVFQIRGVRAALHNFFIAVGSQVVSMKDAIWEHDERDREDLSVEQSHGVDETALLSWNDIPAVFDFGVQEGNGYRSLGKMSVVVHQWLLNLVSSSEGVGAKWLSLHQLFTLFQVQTGSCGIVHLSKKRTFVEFSVDNIADFCWKDRVADFGTFLRAISKTLHIPYQLHKRRPAGTSFHCRVNCLLIRTSGENVQMVDRIFMDRRLVPIRDASKAFRSFSRVEISPRA